MIKGIANISVIASFILYVIVTLIDRWEAVTKMVGSTMLTNISYVFLIIAVISAGVLYFLSNSESQKKQKIRLIQDPTSGKCYIVKGKKISHIPDPETFSYLGSYLGFSWANVETVLQDEINHSYTIVQPLPSIRSYFPQNG